MVKRVLDNYNLLASILVFIVDDCVGLYQSCKFIDWNKAEHLAQHKHALQKRAVACPRGKCPGRSDDETNNCNCTRRGDFRQTLRSYNPQYKPNGATSLLEGAIHDYTLMLWAAKQGACFIQCKHNIFGLSLHDPNESILQIFSIFMSKGDKYLRKFMLHTFDNHQVTINQFENWTMTATQHGQMSANVKRLVIILWGDCGNPLIELLPWLTHLVSFIKSDVICSHVETVISSERTLQLHKTFSYATSKKTGQIVASYIDYKYSWYFTKKPEEIFVFKQRGLQEYLEFSPIFIDTFEAWKWILVDKYEFTDTKVINDNKERFAKVLDSILEYGLYQHSKVTLLIRTISYLCPTVMDLLSYIPVHVEGKDVTDIEQLLTCCPLLAANHDIFDVIERKLQRSKHIAVPHNFKIIRTQFLTNSTHLTLVYTGDKDKAKASWINKFKVSLDTFLGGTPQGFS